MSEFKSGTVIERGTRMTGKQLQPRPRTCQYPLDDNGTICGCTFMGIGRQAHCPDHSTDIAKAELTAMKNGLAPVFDENGKRFKVGEVNLKIKHEYTTSQKMVRKCDCCNTEYEIIVTPGQIEYPRWCGEHRNEFKRNLFLKRMKNDQ